MKASKSEQNFLIFSKKISFSLKLKLFIMKICKKKKANSYYICLITCNLLLPYKWYYFVKNNKIVTAYIGCQTIPFKTPFN